MLQVVFILNAVNPLQARQELVTTRVGREAETTKSSRMTVRTVNCAGVLEENSDFVLFESLNKKKYQHKTFTIET